MLSNSFYSPTNIKYNVCNNSSNVNNIGRKIKTTHLIVILYLKKINFIKT